MGSFVQLYAVWCGMVVQNVLLDGNLSNWYMLETQSDCLQSFGHAD